MDVLTTYEKMLEDLISGRMTSAEAVDTINSTKELIGTIRTYLRAEAYNSTPLGDEDIQLIHAIIEVLQFVYNDSGVEPPISDTEYDRLYEMMINGGGSEVIGYQMGDVGEAHTHKYPTLRGTLKKTYYLSRDEKRTNPSRKYLDEWIESAERMIFESTGKEVNLNDEDIYVFPKWDGVSGIQECEPDGRMILGLTRGDTEHNIGYDITKHLAVTVPTSGITTSHPHGVKYEIMMENDGLDAYNEKYKSDYKSTRSIVSSIINSVDCDERDKLLCPIPLRYIEEGSNREVLHPAVFTYPYIKCKLRDRDKIKKFADDNRYVNGKYRTDGAVIYIINPKLQDILGRSNEKNNFEVAYKFTEETALTELKGIEFSVKNFGRITPVAVFKPVKIKGNTVSRASIGSKARFDTLGLAKGDDVVLHYDIIPYITLGPSCQRANRAPIEFVTECPVCGEHLDYGPDDAIVKCPNPDCPSKATGRILNFINKMKIKNISYATVDLLHKFGFLDNIKDLYKIESRMSDIMQIPTMGAVKVNRIVQSIQDRSTVKDYELFGALGIEGIAKETFKIIFDNIKPNDLMEAVEDKNPDILIEINGIGPAKAKKILDGLRANRKTIRNLSKNVDVYHDSEAPKFTVAFSKVRDNEGSLISLIESLGGSEVDHLNKETSLLIVPSTDSDTSNKIDKARANGIPVVAFNDAAEYIRNRWGNT